MTFFFYFIIALFITTVLIPLLNKYDSRLQLLDSPGERKVHASVIPRGGGIAMVVGTLVPIFLWSELNNTILCFLAGIIVILIFGAWDDSKDLDYRLKLVGQFIAIAIVVINGDIVITRIPVFDIAPLPDYVSYPLTFLVLFGITNAINLADGLDGLARGPMMLRVTVIGLLCCLTGNNDNFLVAAAIAWSTIGFSRLVTFPATIFMRD